jgi:hypothetical protein
MPIDPAQLMVPRHMIVEAEIIKKPSGCCLSSHHRRFSCKLAGKVNHDPWRPATIEFFNSIRHLQTFGYAPEVGKARLIAPDNP